MAPLWTARELAVYLAVSPRTVATLLSTHPARLPPKVAALGPPRWAPEVVHMWVMDQSRPAARVGRPRAAA